MNKLLIAGLIAAAHVAGAQSAPADRQFWMDFVPSWHLSSRASDELEMSFRTAWQGEAATQYWATNTFEWSATPWLGLTAVGAVVESRGPAHGSGYFEARPALGARFTYRGTRLRLNEYVRAEHRIIRPVGEATTIIERVRHREQALVALNHPSLTDAKTAYLIADAEWFFVHNGHGGWDGNQLRARLGLGYRVNAQRSLEVLANDTQRRADTNQRFEDVDHVLRLRWREAF